MIGHHTLWDIYDCDLDTISFQDSIKQALNEIVQLVKLGKVAESYKQFEPIGVTGFILLEESHISAHTWPEHRYAAIDLFSCIAFDLPPIEYYIKTFFKTENVKTSTIERGTLLLDAAPSISSKK